MLFNSRTFLFFFLIVTGGYFALPHRFRWMFLVAASMVFYAAFIPKYLFIILALAITDYVVGILLERTPDSKKRLVLTVSICANLGMLAVFKYFNFFNQNVKELADLIGWNYGLDMLSLALPLGISFHTFQGLSYVIEVYRGRQKAERHFGIYLLYVIFYPQLVAGPIERPQNLLHQFREKHEFSYSRVSGGIKLMLWGLFKKVVIADRLALLVNQVYTHNNPTDFSSFTVLAATVGFAVQIYCDFSGYTDVARGAASVMGFRLMENFRRPYHAASVAEFWRRWHISLSSWFRDYVYIPLGGNRAGKIRQYTNIGIVFFLSGLWHGANWTFIFWGLLHGCYLIFSDFTHAFRLRIVQMMRLERVPRLLHTMRIGITFGLVTIGWVFFRADSVSEAFAILSHILRGAGGSLGWQQLQTALSEWRLTGFELTIAAGGIILMEIIHFLQRNKSIVERIRNYPTWARWSLAYGLLVSIYFLGLFDNIEFIYFQF